MHARRHDFHVAIENWQHDLNIGTVVRTANAFLAREVHIVDRRRWNRRGAMVTDRYQRFRYHGSTCTRLTTRRNGVGVSVSCPRCGGQVRPPDLMHTDWRCDTDGAVLPMHVPLHTGPEIVEAVRAG